MKTAPTTTIVTALSKTLIGLSFVLSASAQAAADGAVAETWHALLSALPDGDPALTRAAAAEIMRHGATSGADMLAGFLAALLPPL